ncbi:hypothetical protein O3P69_018557 [Scylla paramamosain]|uniref:Uncharacterized protein n=1 Tax=Scylla paramamosain TaxID=85552 RepID=A0AAW0T1K1_SCYPA
MRGEKQEGVAGSGGKITPAGGTYPSASPITSFSSLSTSNPPPPKTTPTISNVTPCTLLSSSSSSSVKILILPRLPGSHVTPRPMDQVGKVIRLSYTYP